MRILLAPLWIRALFWAAPAVATLLLAGTVLTSADRQPMVLDWPWGTSIFVFLAVMLAMFLTWRTGRSRDAYLPQVQGLSRPQRSAAVDAVFGGPVPDDPAVLVAALRLGRVYLDRAARYRVKAFVVIGAVLVLLVLLLVTAIGNGNAWAIGYTIMLLIAVPAAAWWWNRQISRVDAQNRRLTEARRHRPGNRV